MRENNAVFLGREFLGDLRRTELDGPVLWQFLGNEAERWNDPICPIFGVWFDELPVLGARLAGMILVFILLLLFVLVFLAAQFIGQAEEHGLKPDGGHGIRQVRVAAARLRAGDGQFEWAGQVRGVGAFNGAQILRQILRLDVSLQIVACLLVGLVGVVEAVARFVNAAGPGPLGDRRRAVFAELDLAELDQHIVL
jgi:hypothetical protein